jgi:hypothetical protein
MSPLHGGAAEAQFAPWQRVVLGKNRRRVRPRLSEYPLEPV